MKTDQLLGAVPDGLAGLPVGPVNGQRTDQGHRWHDIRGSNQLAGAGGIRPLSFDGDWALSGLDLGTPRPFHIVGQFSTDQTGGGVYLHFCQRADPGPDGYRYGLAASIGDFGEIMLSLWKGGDFYDTTLAGPTAQQSPFGPPHGSLGVEVNDSHLVTVQHLAQTITWQMPDRAIFGNLIGPRWRAFQDGAAQLDGLTEEAL